MSVRCVGQALGVGLRFGLGLVLASAGMLVLPARTAHADTVRNFEKVFSSQTNGAISITGNTLLSCDTGNAGCRAALAGGSSSASNNSWPMRRLDADSDSGTDSSSSAGIVLPDGARVLFAGLFWGAARSAGSGGTSTSADGTTMKFKVPGGSYQTVTAGRTDYRPTGNRDYSSYAEVTALVRAAGNGTYWGADVAAATGVDRYSGWSLVVAYEDADEPLRDLSVFSGYATVTGQDVVTTSISGFLAPPSGAVNARIGSVTYEGDASAGGDYLAVNGTRLADAQSPSSNFFGSRITDGGANLTDRNPASLNNLGLDAKVVDAAGTIANSATSAELTFATSGDYYYPAALTTQIDLYAPTIHGDKTVRNLAGNDPAKVGDTLEYTLTYSNTGDDAAIGSVARDVLPPNTTYVPNSLAITAGFGTGAKTDPAGDDQAEYDAASRTVRFRVGTGANPARGGRLAPNASTTVRFRVTVDQAAAGTTVLNTGLLDYTADTLNKPYTYRTDEVATPVAESADVSVTKTASPEPVPAGSELTYTLTVNNAGPSTARDVELADTLPDGVELISATPQQGSCTPSAGKVGCQLGSVAAGPPVTVTVLVRVPAASTATGLTNVATVTTSTSDPNPDNNTGSASSGVTRAADLTLAKTVAPAGPAPGESVTYTLTARNTGPSVARNVRIADTLPAALTAVSVTPAGCQLTGAEISCTTASLAPGATLVVRVVATLDSGYTGGPLTNTAQVVSDTPDPDTGNNTGSATVTPAAPTADLVVSKQTVTDPVVAGEPVRYRITVRNDGPSDARAVVLTDDVPAAVTGVNAETSAGSCTLGGTALSCALGDLTAGSTAEVTVTGTVVSGAVGTLTNAATATSPTADPDPDDNTGRTDDPVTARADLAISKTAQPAPVHAGRPVTYTLTVTNTGPSAARSVTVTDPVPAPLTYVSATASEGSCDQSGGTVSCSVGTVGVGATVTVTVVANVPSGVPPNQLDNTATVSSPTPDPVPGNNSATYTLLTGTQANITLAKTAGPDPVVAGEAISYRLTVRNAGPSDAHGVSVTDPVPAEITGVAATATDGATCTVSGQDVRCGRPTLAAGASFVVTVTGMVAPSADPGELVNTAEAGAQTPEDPTDSDNTSTSSTTVTTRADLAVTKAAPTTVVAGNNLTYRLTIRNDGPSDAVDAFVTDALPAGVRFVSGSGPSGVCTQDPALSEPVVRCPVGRLSPGGRQELTLIVAVAADQPAGTLTNRATASSATPDSNDANNTAEASTTVSTAADLSIAKAVDPSPLVAGGEGLYTITVHNDGPSTARAVTVADTPPAGLSVLAATAAGGDCTVSGTAVSCSLGSLSPGADAVVLVRVAVSSAQTAPVANIATVTSPTPDPDPADNSSTITTEVDRAADLEVVKTADESSLVAGGGVTYRLTVSNHGPSDAPAVEVTDTLPAGLTLLTAEPAQGTCSAAGRAITCALGTLADGTATTVVVTATLDPAYAGGSLTNTAHTTSPVADPSTDNNTSTSTVPVLARADLSVRKYAEPETVTPGSAFDYAIVVNNAGPSVARDVVLTDTVPAALTVLSASAGGRACAVDGRTVRCSLGDLPIGQLAVDLSVRLGSGYDGSTVTNAATASSPTPDPDPANDTGTVTSPVAAKADLAVTKTMSPAVPVAGSTVGYSLTVVNHGPSDARDLVVTDELPRGLAGTSVTAPDGLTCVVRQPADPGHADNPDAGVVECDGGVLSNGASLTIGITATVVPGFAGELKNLARAGSDTPDPVAGNNEDTVAGPIRTAADLSLRKAAATESVAAGGTLGYTLTVSNAGPSTAAGVTVTDELPAGTTLAGTPVSSAGTCSVEGAVVSCAIGRLAPGARAVVTLRVRIGPDFAASTITNTATVTSTTPDRDHSDNTASATVKVAEAGPDEPTPTPSPQPPDDGDLGGTGSPVGLTLLLTAAAVAASGAVLLTTARRRRTGSHH